MPNRSTGPDVPPATRRRRTQPTGPRGDARARDPAPARASTWWASADRSRSGSRCVVTPVLTADRWLAALGGGRVVAGQPAPLTVRVPPFAGIETRRCGADRRRWRHRDRARRGRDARQRVPAPPSSPSVTPTRRSAATSRCSSSPACSRGCSRTTLRRSTRGRLVRVQVVSLALIAILAAVAVKIVHAR